MADVVIVGGGVIGLSIAYELAGKGASVRVLEQGEFGREASWAGAGILHPGNPEAAVTPAARLRAASYRQWPRLSRELLETTGIDNGYRQCGGIACDFGEQSDALQEALDDWTSEGVEVERLTSRQLEKLEPNLSRGVASAYHLPQLSQVRNPRHLKALMAGCTARGVHLVAGAPVVRFQREGRRVAAAHTPTESFAGGSFCIAAGAWTGRLLSAIDTPAPIVPIRGQIVLLKTAALPFRHVIEIGSQYLVPRPDGYVLVGSTEEEAQFDKSNTAAAVSDLLQLATRVVPSLASAHVERCWAGLRPGSIDGLPYLDRLPESDNLFIAAGHFRLGLQNSPATATLMREMILGEEPTLPLEAFACDRWR